MNVSDIPVLASILAGLAAIPFAASSITIDDGRYGFTTILNTTPDIVSDAQGLISKTISDNEIKIEQQNPYGKFIISVTPEKLEEILIKSDRKIEIIQRSDNILWKLTTPNEILIINQSSLKIIEKYQNPYGYIDIIKENGSTQTIQSGNISISRMKTLENDLNYEVSLIKNMTEEIFGTVNVEITYIYCSGASELYADWIRIENKKHSSIDLTSWSIRDTYGTIKTYTFSDTTLTSGGIITVYRNGNSSDDNSTTIWNSSLILTQDDTVELLDSKGKVISSKSCDEW